MLQKIDDEILITSYYKSIELELDNDFILLLQEELERREIFFEPKTFSIKF